MAPWPGEGMKAMSAVKAVRMLHDGCQCSGWCDEIDKHIFVFRSKRPFGVSSVNEGGLKGYSAGRMILP